MGPRELEKQTELRTLRLLQAAHDGDLHPHGRAGDVAAVHVLDARGRRAHGARRAGCLRPLVRWLLTPIRAAREVRGACIPAARASCSNLGRRRHRAVAAPARRQRQRQRKWGPPPPLCRCIAVLSLHTPARRHPPPSPGCVSLCAATLRRWPPPRAPQISKLARLLPPPSLHNPNQNPKPKPKTKIKTKTET